MTQEHALLQREDDLAALSGGLAAAGSGNGTLVCVEGPPGIGKSALLSATAEAARGRRWRVLTAHGGELEQDFPYAVVRQLFESLITELDPAARTRVLSGAAALAGPALGLPVPTPTGTPAPDAGASIMHGLYWLVVNLCAEGPLALLVDDVHWADVASVRFLAYLARRVHALPVALVVTVRDGDHGARGPALPQLLTESSEPVVRPAALRRVAIATLIERSTGDVPHGDLVEAVDALTGGNPFLVRELARALVADGVAPGPQAVQQVRALAPRTVSRSISLRLASLGSAAAAVVRAVAVMGDGAQLNDIAALAGVHQHAAATAVHGLVRVGLLRDGLSLEFVHPILRSTVYADMTAVERSDWHARAAGLLCAQAADADLIANHLMFVAPAGDQHVVARLRAAAETAVRRGAGEAAATYLRRAVAEPVDALERPATLAELGRAETLTRDPAAIEHFEQARTLARDPVERARYTYDLASVLVYVGRWDGVLELLTEAMRDLGERDSALRLRLAALRVAMSHHPNWAADVNGQLPDMLELAAGPEPEAREPRLHLGLLVAVRGKQCELVRGLVSGGLDGGTFVTEEGSGSLAAASAVHALAYVDELDWARETAESLLADARRRGSVLGFVNGIGTRALVALRAGAIAEAEADARACVDLTREHGMALVDPFAVGYLATALLERGQVDEAEALVTDARVPDHFAGMPGWATLLEARARVQRSRGDLAGARKIWTEVGDLWTRCQVMNPNVTSWRSELALLTSDDVPTALDLVESELADARHGGSARAVGIALRARGLVRRGEPGIADLLASAGKLQSTPAALDHARTLVELGAALRRANRRSDAREPLGRGREIAHACGALVLAARADAELRATGARPRRFAMTGRDSLTPSERRVAELALALSSQEIAQELFVTVNTVESHLRRAYAKLGIHSRRELRAALGHT